MLTTYLEIYRRLKKLGRKQKPSQWQIAVDECTQVGLTLIADRAQKLIEGGVQNMRKPGAFSRHLAWLQEQILFGQ